ncbi:MAG: 50S ribosomal protein L4 [Candidatus Micrarchaeales archaeon]|nr:50S ribosomal protein L4 [Candidatus Micrarchaeales archaeon]
MNANILSLQGAQKGSIEVPAIFSEAVREDLIRRAVIAEQTTKLQPKGHYLLAGMNTTARYYGAMSSYRTGRHMGVAIRPRQKLGGGQQGQVRRIPSSVKGKRAHPHKIEKTLIERINKKEYQKAVRSAIAATAAVDIVVKKHSVEKAQLQLPIVLSNEIESIKKTKDVIAMLTALKLSAELEKSKDPSLRKGIRRLSHRRHFRKSALIVVGEDKGIIKAARNIAGVDVCTVREINANLLAPGGVPGRITIWSESAVKSLPSEVEKLSLM